MKSNISSQKFPTCPTNLRALASALALVYVSSIWLPSDATKGKSKSVPVLNIGHEEIEISRSKNTIKANGFRIVTHPQSVGIDNVWVYRGKRLILHKSRVRDYDKDNYMWLAFPLEGKRAKAVHIFDGDEGDFISASTETSVKPLLDLNGDGVLDLIVVHDVGNGGNSYSAYSLSQRPKQLVTISALRSDVKFFDIDHDGKCEAIARDTSFFGWKTSNAQSPMPMAILHLEHGKFVLATTLMKTHAPNTRRQNQLLSTWTKYCKEESNLPYQNGKTGQEKRKLFNLSPKVWGDLLNLVYSGNSRCAFALLDKFWPSNTRAVNLEVDVTDLKDGSCSCKDVYTSKEKFEKMFLEQLSTSPYLNQLKVLNSGDRHICDLRSKNK